MTDAAMHADAAMDADAARPDTGADIAADDGPADAPIDTGPADTGPHCSADAGLSACDGGCVDLANDSAHCGACGRACAANEQCTAGQCDPVCRIGGVVHAAGEVDPANPCQHCDPAASAMAWSPLANGSDCGGGQLCAAGVCALRCVIAGAVFSPSALNPANACQSCDPSADPRAWTAVSDRTACGTGQFCVSAACARGCVINDVFYPAGGADPANACQVCNPARAADAWSPLADGAACGAGSVCSAGACLTGCYVGGTYYADGTVAPSNECRVCTSSRAVDQFSARANNTACGSAQYCTAGTCGPTWHGSAPTGLTPVYGGSAAAGVDGRVYLFGGTSAGVAVATLQIYDPATNTVAPGADVPYAAYGSCAVTAASGQIYVIGGAPADAPVDTVVIYDPASDTYVPGPSLPAPANAHACALGADDKIYVFATDDAATSGDPLTTSHTYVLDPVSNVWTTAAPMPTPRQHVTSVTLRDGRIVVAGGNRGTTFGTLSTLIEIYTPSTDSWSTGASQPAVLNWDVAALRADGRMVIAGGLGFDTGRETYVYDPMVDSWASGTHTTDGHYAGYMAATPNGRLYVITGRSAGSTLSSVVDALY